VILTGLSHGYGKHTGIDLFYFTGDIGDNRPFYRETGKEGVGARFEILVPVGKYRSSK